MNQLARWIFSLLSLSVCCVSAQTINFDDVPDGTDISTHYPGVTFSCAGTHCASPSIFARQTINPYSTPNTVAPENVGLPGVHNPTTGTIKVAIGCSSTKVTVWAKSFQVPEPLNLVQHAILVAQDANGAFLGQAVGTQYDQWEQLTFSSPNTPIKTVLLGVEGSGVAASAQFDNLTVECGGLWAIWIRLPIYWKAIWLAVTFIVAAVVLILILKRWPRSF
jgi:hypothetical protein